MKKVHARKSQPQDASLSQVFYYTSNNQRLSSAGEDDVWRCLLNKSHILEGEVGLVCTSWHTHDEI